MYKTKYLFLLIAIVAACSFFLAGLGLGARMVGTPFVSMVGGRMSGSFEEGYNHARGLLAKSGLVPPTSGKVVSINGTVTSVSDSKLTMKVLGRVVMNPLDPQGPEERTIVVDDKTAIVTNTPFTNEENEAAMKKFQDEMKAGKPATPPQLFKEEAKKISDIKADSQITVFAEDDISVASTIKATKIVILQASAVGMPPVPATPPVTQDAPPLLKR